MEKNERKNVILGHCCMCFFVFSWGFDYVPAKVCLGIMSPMCLLFFRYVLGFGVNAVIKAAKRNWRVISRKDIPILIVCSLFGELIYYQCEYTSLTYLPASIITIILSFVPIVSIITERILYGIHANRKILIGTFTCMAGVSMVILTDISELTQGRIIGYLLAFGAVLCWNIYNFATSSMEKYDSSTLTFFQMLCTLFMCAPMAIHMMPSKEVFTPEIILAVIYVGIVDAGIGYNIYIHGMKILGPTISALYSNFLPVVTAICGMLIFKETLTALQIAGGIIVIISGYMVIREKGRLDQERREKKNEGTDN